MPTATKSEDAPQEGAIPAGEALTAEDHQARWDEVTRDPDLRDLPYNVETNRRGQIVLSPHKNRHSALQEDIQDQLRRHAPEGRRPPEFAIATSRGVKAPDVIWSSPARWKKMQETGDPSTLAPEICVEVMSEANTWGEMKEKRQLYLEAGAEEVWVVSEEGEVHFFDETGDLDGSSLAEGIPDQL